MTTIEQFRTDVQTRYPVVLNTLGVDLDKQRELAETLTAAAEGLSLRAGSYCSLLMNQYNFSESAPPSEFTFYLWLPGQRSGGFAVYYERGSTRGPSLSWSGLSSHTAATLSTECNIAVTCTCGSDELDGADCAYCDYGSGYCLHHQMDH